MGARAAALVRRTVAALLGGTLAVVIAVAGTARAANTAAQVCQRWVCDRADMSEGV